jgi:hypothetical protein
MQAKDNKQTFIEDCSFILINNRFHGGLVTAHRFLCNKTCLQHVFGSSNVKKCAFLQRKCYFSYGKFGGYQEK